MTLMATGRNVDYDGPGGDVELGERRRPVVVPVRTLEVRRAGRGRADHGTAVARGTGELTELSDPAVEDVGDIAQVAHVERPELGVDRRRLSKRIVYTTSFRSSGCTPNSVTPHSKSSSPAEPVINCDDPAGELATARAVLVHQLAALVVRQREPVGVRRSRRLLIG